MPTFTIPSKFAGIIEAAKGFSTSTLSLTAPAITYALLPSPSNPPLGQNIHIYAFLFGLSASVLISTGVLHQKKKLDLANPHIAAKNTIQNFALFIACTALIPTLTNGIPALTIDDSPSDAFFAAFVSSSIIAATYLISGCCYLAITLDRKALISSSTQSLLEPSAAPSSYTEAPPPSVKGTRATNLPPAPAAASIAMTGPNS